MTAFSAKVDENSQWFDTPLPGRLSDVFGIRTSEFYRPSTPPEISLNGKVEKATIGFYEVLEPHTAKTMAMFTNTPEEVARHHSEQYRQRTRHLCRRSCADVGACSARTQPLRRPPHRKGTGDSFRRLRARG